MVFQYISLSWPPASVHRVQRFLDHCEKPYLFFKGTHTRLFSQTSFLIPGMVMSMYSKIHEEKSSLDIEDIDKCLQGNLCRCTGYRPIVEGFRKCAKQNDKTV